MNTIKGNEFDTVKDTVSYLGIKRVWAKPMDRLAYNEFRGWGVPSDEDPSDKGYIVQYSDGYISWSPKQQFEHSYSKDQELTFGEAIEGMKQGYKLQRTGWNGKGMFIVYMPPLKLLPFNTQKEGPKVNDRIAKYIGKETPLDCQPYIAMFNAQRQWIPGWLASQSDILSNDWHIID